jgi:hypothetical protein
MKKKLLKLCVSLLEETAVKNRRILISFPFFGVATTLMGTTNMTNHFIRQVSHRH